MCADFDRNLHVRSLFYLTTLAISLKESEVRHSIKGTSTNSSDGGKLKRTSPTLCQFCARQDEQHRNSIHAARDLTWLSFCARRSNQNTPTKTHRKPETPKIYYTLRAYEMPCLQTHYFFPPAE